MSSKQEFEVDGVKFYLKQMPVLQALDLTVEVGTLVAGLFQVASSMASRQTFDLSCLKSMRPLAEAFFPQCEVLFDGTQQVLPLKPLVEQIFGGKSVRLTAWLIECVSRQFADFLELDGRNLLERHLSVFASHLGFDGTSGTSRQTVE